MSWGIKIAGSPKAVAAALRGYSQRPNMYPDAQRDEVLSATANQVDKFQTTQGVCVEGSGHAGSNFEIKMTFIEIAPESECDRAVTGEGTGAETAGDPVSSPTTAA